MTLKLILERLNTIKQIAKTSADDDSLTEEEIYNDVIAIYEDGIDALIEDIKAKEETE